MIIKVKTVLKKTPDQPKEPRKKIELQLKTIYKQFKIQLEKLEQVVESPDIPSYAIKTGKHLLNTALRFEELQLAQINLARLQNLPNSLIDPSDFSLWVRQEMVNLTELLYHFLSTLGDL